MSDSSSQQRPSKARPAFRATSAATQLSTTLMGMAESTLRRTATIWSVRTMRDSTSSSTDAVSGEEGALEFMSRTVYRAQGT